MGNGLVIYICTKLQCMNRNSFRYAINYHPAYACRAGQYYDIVVIFASDIVSKL